MPKKRQYSINQYADFLANRIHEGNLVQTVKEILALPKLEAVAVTGHVFLRINETQQEQFALTTELQLPTQAGETIINVRSSR